jgi:valyl-tRNA synthetase
LDKIYDHRAIETRHSAVFPVVETVADAVIGLLPVPTRPAVAGDAALLLVCADIIFRRNRMQGQRGGWRGGAGMADVVSRLPPLGLSTGVRRCLKGRSRERRRLQRLFAALHERGHIKCRAVPGGRIWTLLVSPDLPGVLRNGIRFVPEAWRNSCMQWLGQGRNWRISLPGGDGEPVPAWICGGCAAMRVAERSPAACTCGSARWTRVSEVLDTRFVAAGRFLHAAPGESGAPVSLLVASAEAVAPAAGMIVLAGLAGMASPFRETLAVGRFQGGGRGRSERGVLMAAYRSYGAEAVRLALVSSASTGRNVRLLPGRLKGAHALAGKVWHAARFARLHLRGDEGEETAVADAGDASLWALHRLNIVSEKVNECLDGLRLHEALAMLDGFVRRDLCDWYLELLPGDLDVRSARRALRHVLLAAVRLLHPFLPLLTQDIQDRLGAGRLESTPYPGFENQLVFPEAYARIERLRRLVRHTRRLRSENGVAAGRWVTAVLWARDGKEAAEMTALLGYYETLCRCCQTRVVGDASELPPGFRAVLSGWEIRLPFADEAERRQALFRLQAEAAGLDAEIDRLQRNLTAGRPTTVRLQARKRRLQQAISRRQFIGGTLDDIS